jgi:hypothetical protein
MLRSALAFACAIFAAAAPAWGQQPPPPQAPPDTKAARERHRIEEKEPPPPEGPWGPDEFGLTWKTPVWRGLTVDVGTYGGASLNLDLPRGLAASSDGVNPPIFEKLEWNSEHFRSTSITLGADLDMMRLSVAYYHGTFDAEGTFINDNGVTQIHTPVEISGPAYGLRFTAYWPALRYRDSLFDVSVGPILSLGWLHEETHGIPGGVLLTADAQDVLTGSLGPKASGRVIFGRYEVEVNAEYSFMTGGVRGWVKEFSAGFGIHF